VKAGLPDILKRLPPGNRPVSGQHVSGGRETRVPRDNYDWDGIKRFSTGSKPYLVYQHTLAGEGELLQEGKFHPQNPGDSFLVCVPSTHRYRLPASSPQWSFFYLSVSHPYVVERLRNSIGPVLRLGEAHSHLAALKAMRVLELLMAPPMAEPFAEERALFDWMLEIEESALQQRFPDGERQAILQALRAKVLQRLSRPPTVDELARSEGKSRSLYSHEFRRSTGCTPADTMRDVRLHEVKRLLLQSNDTLDAVAAATGFADANHLCKAFRRAFGLTPGAFRQQAGMLPR
jgi:AraC family transcriptional regulator